MFEFLETFLITNWVFAYMEFDRRLSYRSSFSGDMNSESQINMIKFL